MANILFDGGNCNHFCFINAVTSKDNFIVCVSLRTMIRKAASFDSVDSAIHKSACRSLPLIMIVHLRMILN